MFARDAVAGNYRTFSPTLSPEKLLLVGGTYSQSRCLHPAIAEAAVRLLCVLIFPSPWVRSPFGVLLAHVRAVCTLQIHGSTLAVLQPGHIGWGRPADH